MLVNNRPDGEEPGQPLGTEIEAAARAAGIDYRYIPIIRGIRPGRCGCDAGRDQGDEGQDAGLLPHGHSIGATPGPWPRAKNGMTREEIEERLAAVGVDPTPIAHLL